LAGKEKYQSTPLEGLSTDPIQEVGMSSCEILFEKKRKEKAKSRRSFLTGFLFYFSMIMVVVIAYQFGSIQGGPPRDVLGFSAMTVLTGSMQKEIPKGSLVVTRQVDPSTLQVGDNITYMRDPETSVTHQIVGIYENYDNSGIRGFQTQGVNNLAPDKDIVKASNVVGKVIFHSKSMGDFINYIKKNILLSGLIATLTAGLIIAIHTIIKPNKGKKAEKDKHTKVRTSATKGQAASPALAAEVTPLPPIIITLSKGISEEQATTQTVLNGTQGLDAAVTNGSDHITHRGDSLFSRVRKRIVLKGDNYETITD